MKTIGLLVAIAIAFTVGILAVLNSPQFPVSQMQNPSVGPKRDPAAIKKVFDFSNLNGTALSEASKQRLINGARILQDGSSIGIELGHFVVAGQDGKKAFACERYDRITLTFEGDGMAIAGEKPVMEVEGSCEISADINNISPLWIPVAKIIGEPVADGEFDFREGKAIRLRFTNVAQFWPKLWALKSLRMFNSQSLSGVDVTPEELRQLSSKPILVQF